jgi:hypothetical protein
MKKKTVNKDVDIKVTRIFNTATNKSLEELIINNMKKDLLNNNHQHIAITNK